MIVANHFDALYPINLDITVQLTTGLWRVDELLADVKRKLPHNLRYERATTAARRHHQALIRIEAPTLSVRRLAGLILGALPAGWQLTALPGYLILYRETVDYETALTWWRSTHTGVIETTGPAHTTPPTGDQPRSSDEPEDDDDPGARAHPVDH